MIRSNYKKGAIKDLILNVINLKVFIKLSANL